MDRDENIGRWGVIMYTVGNHIVVFETEGKMVVRTEDPVKAAALKSIPGIETMQAENQVLAGLPWCEESCRILNNVGIDVTGAAPFLRTHVPLIEGKYMPMAHQLFTAAFITLNPRCYILNDPRTGKTGSVILGVDYLQKNRYMQGGMLVLTTVTTIPDVWAASIKSTLQDANVVIVHGKKRKEALKQPADWYVSNYDSCRLNEQDFINAIKDGRIGGCIIDELTHVGNVSNKRHKSIDNIVNLTKLPIVIGATGSPGENAEMVYGMAKIVNRDKLPCDTKQSWLDMTTYQYGPENVLRRMSYHAPQIILNTLQPAVRFKKEDVMDLPPVLTQNRTCALSKEQTRMRDEFKKQAMALADSGVAISASNGGVLFQKIMQVSQGFVHDNNGSPIYLDHKERTQLILEAIQETANKVVIFGTYRAIIAKMATDLRKEGYSVGVVDGSVTGKERAKVLNNFQNETHPHIAICHPTTTAYGTELSVADTMIVNGPPPLGGHIYTQMLERLSSQKQQASSINIIRVMSSPEEIKFFKTLDSGRQMGNFIANLFEDYARGLI